MKSEKRSRARGGGGGGHRRKERGFSLTRRVSIYKSCVLKKGGVQGKWSQALTAECCECGRLSRCQSECLCEIEKIINPFVFVLPRD
jgi:hypothetical protein